MLGSIDNEKPNQDRLFDLIYLGRRVGIKLRSMLVVGGIYNAQKDQLPRQMADENRSKAEKPCIKELAERVVTPVDEILGTTKAPGQWQLYSKYDNGTRNKRRLCPIRMTNGTVRSIVKKFHLLIIISD